MKPTTGIVGCWARPGSGPPTTTPPRSAMKSRRLMRAPRSTRMPEYQIAIQEANGEPPGRLPARYGQYLDLLTSHAPVDRIWAGPAYMFAEVAPTVAAPRVNMN